MSIDETIVLTKRVSDNTVTTRFPVIGSLGNHTLVESDIGKALQFNSPSAVTLDLLGSSMVANGFEFFVQNLGAGIVTIDPDGTETINGLSSLNIEKDQAGLIVCDGTNWVFLPLGGVQKLVSGTGVNVDPLNGIGTVTLSLDPAETVFSVSSQANAGIDVIKNDTTGNVDLALDPAESVLSVVAGDGIEVDKNDTTGVATISIEAGPGNANPNLLINGGFDVWQRGTSFTPTGSSTEYSSDRWAARRGSIADFTVSQQGSEGEFSIRIQRDSGTSGTKGTSIGQTIETNNVSGLFKDSAKMVTISFSAKKGADYSPASDILTSSFRTGTGTDEGFTKMYNGQWTGDGINSKNHTLTSSFQTFTHTHLVPSGTKELGMYFEAMPLGTAGANDWYEVEWVKMEVSDAATQFVSRPYGEELALCKRYLCRYDGISTYDAVATGLCDKTTEMYPVFYFPVKLRDVPTLSYSAAADFAVRDAAVNRAVTSIIDGSALGTLTGSIQVNTTGLTVGRCANLLVETGGWIDFDAEL